VSRKVQTPRPSTLLTRLFGIKGAIDLRLDETITPVVDVGEEPRQLCMGRFNVAAGGAGLRSEVALVNTFAQNSGLELRLHNIVLSTASQIFHLVIPSAALTGFSNITTESVVAPLRAGAPQGALQSSNIAGATSAGSFYELTTPAAGQLQHNFLDPIVIPALRVDVSPFRAIIIRPQNDNVAIRGSIIWSEPIVGL